MLVALPSKFEGNHINVSLFNKRCLGYISYTHDKKVSTFQDISFPCGKNSVIIYS